MYTPCNAGVPSGHIHLIQEQKPILELPIIPVNSLILRNGTVVIVFYCGRSDSFTVDDPFGGALVFFGLQMY